MAASAVAGGIFNAFAFAGACWIFSKVDHGDYQAEQKRHDLALEKLQKERDEWNKKETELRDKIIIEEKKRNEATADLKEGDDALENYRKELEYLHKKSYPSLDDFYTPTQHFFNYLSAIKISMVAGGVVLLGKFVF